MYGQTNCFVGTQIKYGLFAINDNEAYVCTYRAARNMAFQGIMTVRGQINQLAEIDGSLIVGAKIKAPFSINPEVYVLPMENVLPTKVCRRITLYVHKLTRSNRVPASSLPSRPTLQTISKRSRTCARSPSSTRSTLHGRASTLCPSSRPRRTAR